MGIVSSIPNPQEGLVSEYNATLVSLDADGKIVSTTIGLVDDEGFILRAAGFWCHLNGTREYDAAWRSSRFSMVASVEILRDGGAAYKARLSGLALPPAYKAAV